MVLGHVLLGFYVFSIFCFVVLIFMFEELLKSVLCFLLSIFLLFLVFENSSICYLLVLLYIGGLFTLVVFVSSLHFVRSLRSLKQYVLFFVLALAPFSFSLAGQSAPVVFWVFGLFSFSTTIYFLFLLFVVLLILSWALVSGKSSRNL